VGLRGLALSEIAAETRGSAATHTSVRVAHRIGALQIDVEFALSKPWTVLFGPSGSGKTTLLRAIAGLLRPAAGRIVCSGDTQFDSTAGVFVPAHLRRIPMAAQQASLFPHKTLRENVGYANPAHGAIGADDALWTGFELTDLLGSVPATISGGEAQRVNLARAVAAPKSRLLLLDEPFTGMDAARRDRLLPWLRGLLRERGVPVLSVTHDVAEAYELGAEVIELAEGKIVQQGLVEVVLATQRDRLLRQLGSASWMAEGSSEPYLAG
jgi:molybdate transport system ATP-binding protein